ncbi:hypothetical protein M405DRAFT_938956 [Rhizopogon salebrosus TDB-379]|nr:hypothetical protein M405DRAFT_938956 [Rhizopogon salebrosus TDB-379]
MTVISNDPRWGPTINVIREVSYISVASFAILVYDWALTFGQEFELVWSLDSMLCQSEYLSRSTPQAICSSRGLSISGTKDQLRDAIFQDVSKETCAMEASPPTEACSGVIPGFAEHGGV